MAAPNPRLSIGFPVYNGEQYIRQALDSILAQTYCDFEIVISDNASVDSTASICQEYAVKDSRIRYFRQEHNVGAAANFNFVFSQARGELFKWAAHDDVLHPEFLEECIAALDALPDVILAYTKVNRIDAQGDITGAYDYPMRVDHPLPSVRFGDLILINHFCVAVFGVIRTEFLAQTPLIAPFVGSDRTLLAELGLRGRLCEVDRYLFNRRDHPLASTRAYRHHRRLSWFDPRQRDMIHLPYWRNGFEYLRLVIKVPLVPAERLKCIGLIARWLWLKRKQLIDDFKGIALQLFPFRRVATR